MRTPSLSRIPAAAITAAILTLPQAGVPSVWAATQSTGAITKIGNGDDGADLEGARPVRSGKIVSSRKKALALLKRLNVQGVAGLGLLQPELERSPLYLARMDVPAGPDQDLGSFHADMSGRAYARTLAEPHAATRFFPQALKLDDDQLVALHVHEALHRSLPASVREDESKVAAITLAITAPGATHDQVAQAVAKHLPADELRASLASAQSPSEEKVPAESTKEAYPIPDDAQILNPSTVSYQARVFQSPSRASTYPVEQMHQLSVFLYPFGTDRFPLGMGVDVSMIGRETGFQPGPLGLSGRLRLWSGRGFDVGIFGQAALNMLSAEELKNSPLGRDVGTFGLSARKDFPFAYVELAGTYSTPGGVKQKLGSVEYQHDFGGVFGVNFRGGAKLWKFHVGAFTELFLADYYRVSGGAFSFDSGRYRLIAAGPEIAFRLNWFSIAARGQFLVEATRDANFDYLGNLMGQGVAQGNVGITASAHF